MKLLLVMAGTAALLVGCGGGSADGGGFATASELADAIGCEDFEATSEELFVQEGGPCQLDGAQVTVYKFAGSEQRDSWLEIARGFGGLFLVGDAWVVTGDREQLEAVQAEVGGELD